tara:strand:- start:837 stop:1130 length:294 start_codon:yes stop_codon:yes gene_type:complete
MEEIIPIISLAAGPAGAVVVLLIVLYGIYKLFIEHMLPVAKNYVDNQHETMQNILVEHKEDRKAFQESIGQLAKRQEKLEDDVEDIKTDVKKIMEKI